MIKRRSTEQLLNDIPEHSSSSSSVAWWTSRRIFAQSICTTLELTWHAFSEMPLACSLGWQAFLKACSSLGGCRKNRLWKVVALFEDEGYRRRTQLCLRYWPHRLPPLFRRVVPDCSTSRIHGRSWDIWDGCSPALVPYCTGTVADVSLHCSLFNG